MTATSPIHTKDHSHSGVGIYFVVLAALLLLTGLTVAVAFINFGMLNMVIALAIAFLKATLVMLFFMHLKGSSGLLKIFVIGAFAFLGILLGMTFNDYATRGWGNHLDKDSWIKRSPHHYVETMDHDVKAASGHH